jgi:hypothetical protein
LQRLQDEELHDEEEQASPSGQGEVQEVLPQVQQAHGSQGDALIFGRYSEDLGIIAGV